jgi:quercetin dioxygenase-like cupin family protein
MSIDSLHARTLSSTKTGTQNSSLFSFDFPTSIRKMKESHGWAKGELKAMILLDSPGKQILLTAFHEGTEIDSFQSNESVTLQIIEGKLNFQTSKESTALGKGQFHTIYEHIKYSLTAWEDTVFLLTIASVTLKPAKH